MMDITQNLLHRAGILIGHETLSDFLSNDYSHTDKLVNQFMFDLQEEYRPVPEIRRDRLWVYVMVLISISDSLFEIGHSNESEEVKANAMRLRVNVNDKIVAGLSPYILRILKWDIDRRYWKHPYDEYKFSYLRKVSLEIESELTGSKNQMVKKYLNLLIDYLLMQFDKGLRNIRELEKLGLKSDEAFKSFNQFKKMADLRQLDEFIDQEAEQSFVDRYRPYAQLYLEGLIMSTARYDYLLFAFIEAQNDYKKIIDSMLGTMTGSMADYYLELRKTLAAKNVKRAIEILTGIFATVPRQLIKNTNESYYHLIIHFGLQMIGCNIQSEVPTNVGRIDAVLEFDSLVYVIEFKLGSSEAAIDQIKERKYFQRYLLKRKPIILLGLSFDTKEMNIREHYKMEELAPDNLLY